MVNWNVQLSNRDIHTGKTDDGSWIKFRTTLALYPNNVRIANMRLTSEHGVATIDDWADGYFLGNKVIAILPSTININLVAIGYWKKHDDMARIKWYNSKTMSLVFTEARPVTECGLFLVKNPEQDEKNSFHFA